MTCKDLCVLRTLFPDQSVLSLVMLYCFVFFVKQKTAYEVRISVWSSDVCSSDLAGSAASSRMAMRGLRPLTIGRRWRGGADFSGLPRCGSGRGSLLGPPRRAASPASPSCSISFRPSGCGPPLARASSVVLAAHPRLGGALGFLGSAGCTAGFYLPQIGRASVRERECQFG